MPHTNAVYEYIVLTSACCLLEQQSRVQHKVDNEVDNVLVTCECSEVSLKITGCTFTTAVRHLVGEIFYLLLEDAQYKHHCIFYHTNITLKANNSFHRQSDKVVT